MRSLQEIIAAAAGEEEVDLLIRNARVINVFSGEIEHNDVAIYGGKIVGFGDYPARKAIDLQGNFLCPGLIDGHVHVESSMVTIPEFARAVLPSGTTSAVIDPHEIANVLGGRGIRFMIDSARGVPFNVFVMLPSCVPATSMETSGAVLTAADLQLFFSEPSVIGLAEMMDFPGVIHRDPEVLRKIKMARGRRMDGHAPSLSGKNLSAYVAAGIGSDHECTGPRETKDKLKTGMRIMVREGTTARNLKDLLPLVTAKNGRRFFFVTDDRHPKELLEEGHINSMVKQAIRQGLDPVLAIQMATLNTAEYFRLDDLGAVAPGYRADLVAFDHLSRFQVRKVFKDGVLVAENGRMLRRSMKEAAASSAAQEREIRIKPVREEDLALRADQPLAKVIQIVPGQIITRKVMKSVVLRDGVALPDLKEDILKIAVVERHHGSGNIGLGFVQGFGLRKGAIASTVAHDSHNLVVVGTDDRDIVKGIEILQEMKGGLAVVSGGKGLASLPLPVAGLMTTMPLAQVHRRLEALLRATKSLGCPLPDPFMTLSFLSLPVIPELKLTDKGLVDVARFKIVPVFGTN